MTLSQVAFVIATVIGSVAGLLTTEMSNQAPPVCNSSSPANKSLRGSRGPKAGVRGIPSPFINLDERGRDTPYPSLLPLLPMRKDFLDGVLVETPSTFDHSA
jgi:hypothetical protein